VGPEVRWQKQLPDTANVNGGEDGTRSVQISAGSSSRDSPGDNLNPVIGGSATLHLGVNLFPSTWSREVRIQSTTRVGTAMEFNDQRSSLQPLKWDSDTGFCWISHLPPDQYEFANFSPKLCGIFKKAPVPLSRHLSPSSAFSLESRNFLDPLEWGRKTTEKTRLRTPSLREAPSVAVIYFGKK
jgi:hypothetical protein